MKTSCTRLAGVWLVAIAASACNSANEALACTDQQQAGIAVFLEDAVTGSAGPFSNVVVTAREGSYEATVQVALLDGLPNPAAVLLVPERAGTYDVNITAEGYEPWERTGIAVPQGACSHVVTQTVVAKVTPAD